MKFFNRTWSITTQGGLSIILIVACAISLAACGGDTAPPTQVAQPTINPIQAKGANSINVELSEWAVVPASIGLPSGATRIIVTNKGEFSHNLVIKSGNTEIGRTPNFTKAESPIELEVVLQPGSYTWLCDIPGHAEQGMTGTVNVGP